MLVDKLIASLTVIDEDIVQEAVRQPRIFVMAADYRVLKMRRKLRAEAALDQWDASLGLSLRKATTGTRVTEGYFKARIVTSKKHIRLQRELDKALEEEEYAKLLVSAAQMRRDSLRIIAEAQMYTGMRSMGEAERIQQTKKIARTLQRSRRKNYEQ